VEPSGTKNSICNGIQRGHLPFDLEKRFGHIGLVETYQSLGIVDWRPSTISSGRKSAPVRPDEQVMSWSAT
jgi:hypothetical protein